MRQYGESLVAYIRTVFHMWGVVVSAASVALVLALLSAGGVDTPRWVWVGLVVLALVVAQFLAFHHERMKSTLTPPVTHIVVQGDATFHMGGGGAIGAVVVTEATPDEPLAVQPPTQQDEAGES